VGRGSRLPALALLASFALPATLVAGCGTTNIYTSDPGARVIADGQTLGRGQGQLTRRGFPSSTQVVVKTDDGRQGELRIRREFTGVTFLMGLFTYGVCLVACWEYPDTVFIPLPGGTTPGYGPAPVGAPPAVDPWLTPPPGWHPPASKTE
jgi:hypothetical protein